MTGRNENAVRSTWDPPADRTQVGPMLTPWTLLSGALSYMYIQMDQTHWISSLILSFMIYTNRQLSYRKNESRCSCSTDYADEMLVIKILTLRRHKFSANFLIQYHLHRQSYKGSIKYYVTSNQTDISFERLNYWPWPHFLPLNSIDLVVHA